MTNELSLSSSAIFNQLVGREKIISLLNTIDLDGDRLSDEVVASNMFLLERKAQAGKAQIQNHVKKEKDFILLKQKKPFPTYINFLPLVKDGRLNIVIDTTRIINKSDSMFPKQFYALLQGALINYNIQSNPNKILANKELIRLSAIAYSQLLIRILDKMHGITLYTEWADLVRFTLTKFFLLNHAHMKDTGKNVDSMAYGSITGTTSISEIIEIVHDLYDDDWSTDFFKMCENLSKAKHLQSLKTRDVIENYIRMYGESTLLALDYLPQFLYMIFSAQVQGNMNNEFRINDVAKDHIEKAYRAYIRTL